MEQNIDVLYLNYLMEQNIDWFPLPELFDGAEYRLIPYFLSPVDWTPVLAGED